MSCNKRKSISWRRAKGLWALGDTFSGKHLERAMSVSLLHDAVHWRRVSLYRKYKNLLAKIEYNKDLVNEGKEIARQYRLDAAYAEHLGQREEADRYKAMSASTEAIVQDFEVLYQSQERQASQIIRVLENARRM